MVIAFDAESDLAVSAMMICGFFGGVGADIKPFPLAETLGRRGGGGEGSGKSWSRHCETFLAIDVEDMIWCA